MSTSTGTASAPGRRNLPTDPRGPRPRRELLGTGWAARWPGRSQGDRGPRRRRGGPAASPRGGACAGRRVGLRQDHDGARDDGPGQATTGRGPVRRASTWQGPSVVPAPRADGLPGPDGVPEPPPDDLRDRREGLRIHRIHRGPAGEAEEELVARALSRAGLRPPERFFLLYPHELSGGQRQRVVIAGALVLEPEVIVADEPVSSLDASVRGEILKLLMKLRDDDQISIIVVTHDLGLAWTIADRVAVMYLGRIVEIGPAEDVLTRPLHPYTRALLDVVPETEGIDRPILAGEPPDPTRSPQVAASTALSRGRLGRRRNGRCRGSLPRRGPRAPRAPARPLRGVPPGGGPQERRRAVAHQLSFRTISTMTHQPGARANEGASPPLRHGDSPISPATSAVVLVPGWGREGDRTVPAPQELLQRAPGIGYAYSNLAPAVARRTSWRDGASTSTTVQALV